MYVKDIAQMQLAVFVSLTIINNEYLVAWKILKLLSFIHLENLSKLGPIPENA